MAIWGRLIGGAAGFMLGGPLGALLGAAAGYAIDDYVADRNPPRREGDPLPVAFTVACIALSAKMAKADGIVTDDEVAAFDRLFEVPEGEQGNVAKVFDLARRSTAGFESYARQVAELFPEEPEVLEKLLGALFHIARADGLLKPEEIAYLRRVAAIFGFDDREFARIRATHDGGLGERLPESDDPYQVLGVSPDMPDSEIRAVWLAFVKENHPDRLVAHGLPPEFVALANEKLARINDAYDRIRKGRAMAGEARDG